MSRRRKPADPRRASLENLARPIERELELMIRARAPEQTITVHAAKCRMGKSCTCTVITLTFGASA
jgi:hypothetical protein